MRKINILFICIAFLSLQNCFEDSDDNAISTTNINDFVWKGLNLTYLYQSQVPDLSNDRFSTNEEYTDFLNDFDSPEALFQSLRYMPETVDRFSIITDNFRDLENRLQGTSLSNGIEFNLHLVPNSNNEVYGVITQVLNNSVASELGLERGMIFRGINGNSLTVTDVDDSNDALFQDTFTLNFANYNTNNTETIDDDTVELNGNDVSLTKVEFSENPVHRTEILDVNGTNVGYLMYNGFTSAFEAQLNNAFSEFQTAGIQELVLDLRYNGGGSIQTATYLASMINNQNNGAVFSKLEYNDNLSDFNTTFNFTNNIPDVGAINSVNLSRVYVLTTNRRTASASELIINSLKPYMDVIVVGENTVGKTQASRIVYDSPGVFTSTNANRSHSYAMLPLIANSINVNDTAVPANGLEPDIEISEVPFNLGVLGNVNEPLLEAALEDMGLASRNGLYNNTSSNPQIRPLKSILNKTEQLLLVE